MVQTVDELRRLSSIMRDEIREVFDSRRPFGPHSADGFRDHPKIAELVFSTENQIWREYSTRPRIIVGRKGSGKTSVLRQTGQSEYYKLVHRVSTSEMLLQCIDSLFTGPTDLRNIPAEVAGKVWGQMINTSLMVKILEQEKLYKFPNIERYFEISGLINEKKGRNFFALLRSFPSSGDSGSIGTVINVIVTAILHVRGETGLEYESAVIEMDKYLDLKNIKAVIILDSLEEYPAGDH